MNQESSKIRLIMELRQAGIVDPKVMSAIERVPREIFIPESLQDRAYENTALPIASGQTISQPYIVAYMTELLALKGDERVLEIGTGSGYQAAVLSALCKKVYTVERFRNLLIDAKKIFAKLDLHNVITRLGDGFLGWPEQAPFDRIIVTAAPQEVPQALIEQLKPGGIMVIPVGENSANQSITRIKKTEDGIKSETLIPVRFVPLVPGAVRSG